MEDIHLFNGFMNPYGGSERETLAFYSLLKKHGNVYLWATSSRASRDLLSSYPIKRISLINCSIPRGGVYIFLGAHWRNKYWTLFLVKPIRLIYVFNTFHPRIADLIKKHPFWLRWPKSEVVLISNFQSKILNINGVIHPSPIDISRFTVGARNETGVFTIGRLSRDDYQKHNIEDVELYKKWLGLGHKILIQGGSFLRDQLPKHGNLLLTQEGAMPAERFMNQLDVFYYRSGTHVETFGRVVFEAMASGVPVVCFYYGGYAEHIRHGENGYLFKTSHEAQEIIQILYSDVALRRRIGMAGRITVEKMFSIKAVNKRMEFYQKP